MLSKTGAADYRPPEVALALPYGPAVDVWGVGSTLCEAPLADGILKRFPS